jgi:hypothetical protein
MNIEYCSYICYSTTSVTDGVKVGKETRVVCTDIHRDSYRVYLLMTLFLGGKFESTRKSFRHSTPVFRKHIPALEANNLFT